MRKRIKILFLSLLAALLLGGCTGRAYDSSDKKRVEELGRERLEAYLEEHLPDAQILSVKAVEVDREVTLKTLTNYVCGEYRADGITCEYYYDVTNDRLFTSRYYYKFASRVKEKVIGDLALADTAQILDSAVEIYLPDVREQEGANRDVGDGQGQLPPAEQTFVLTAPVIPLEVGEDVAAYVDDENRRELIYVNLTFAVDAAQGAELSGYGFHELYELPRDNRMYYGYLCIYNAWSVTYDRIGYGAKPTIVSKETLTAAGENAFDGSYRICYEVLDDAGQGESQIHGVVYRKTEFLDTRTGEIRTGEERFDLTGNSE